MKTKLTTQPPAPAPSPTFPALYEYTNVGTCSYGEVVLVGALHDHPHEPGPAMVVHSVTTAFPVGRMYPLDSPAHPANGQWPRHWRRLEGPVTVEFSS